MDRKTLALGIAVVLVGFTVACGGSTPASPSSVAPAPAPQASTIPARAPEATLPSGPFTQTITGAAGRFENVFHDLTSPQSGKATITLRWLSSKDDLDLGLTEATCRIDESGCPIAAESAQGSGTQEQVSTIVADGQVLRIWVGNANPHAVSYTIDVDIQ